MNDWIWFDITKLVFKILQIIKHFAGFTIQNSNIVIGPIEDELSVQTRFYYLLCYTDFIKATNVSCNET